MDELSNRKEEETREKNEGGEMRRREGKGESWKESDNYSQVAIVYARWGCSSLTSPFPTMADSFFAFEGEMMQEYPHAQYHHMSSHSHSPSPTPSHHTVESSSNSSFNDEYAFVPPTTTAEEEFLHPTAHHHHGQDYGLFPMMMKVKQEMMLEEAFDFTSSSNSMELDADHPPMIGQVHSNSSGSPSLAPLPTIKYEPMTSPSPLLPPSAVNSNVATATAIVTPASVVTAATPVHAVLTPSSVPSPIVMAAAVPSSSLAHQPTMAVPIARGKASPRQVLAKVLTKKENVQPVSPNAVTALSAFNSPSITSATSPAAALIFSPSVTAALPIHHNSVRSTSSISSNASASGSGGSGQNSDASDSDSSSEGGVVGVRSSSKKNRKRKSVRTGSVGGSNSDDLTGMVEEGEDCGLAVDMTGMPLTGDKRQQRLQRNRASAQLSRERKKQYMRLLENQLKEMTDLNEGLTLQVTQLTQENATLKSRLAKLAMRERVAGRYPRPSSANGPASAMPGLSPVSSSSLGSENDSSLPTTPMIMQQRDEESCTNHDLPQAKKLKVAAYSSPSSSSSPVNGSGSRGGFNARTGMLFFTLVMGVCLFHNLVGLDTIHQGRVHSPAVLESIDDVLPSSASIVVPTTPSSTMVLAPRVGRALLATSSSPKSTTSPSREDVDAFALVPVLDSSSKAIDVASARHSEAHMMGGIDSAISAQHLNTHLLRRILVGGNLTYSDSYQYLFAPNALRITEEVWNGLLNSSASSSSEVPSPAATLMEDVEGTEKQVALFDRTRLQRGTKRTRIGHAIATPTKTNAQERLRAKLPLATTTATPPATASSNAPLQVGDKLLLWLPLHAVNSDNSTNGGHDTKQAIVELSCNIAGLRPIDIE